MRACLHDAGLPSIYSDRAYARKGCAMHRSTAHATNHLFQHPKGVVYRRIIVGEGHEIVGRALKQQSTLRTSPGHGPRNVLAGVMEEAHFRHTPDAAQHVRVAVPQIMQPVQQSSPHAMEVGANSFLAEDLE